MKQFIGWLLSITVALTGLVGCSSSENEQAEANKIQAIKVGSSGSYYPFTFVEKGELQGFEIDLWNEIGKRVNQPIEFVTANFSGLFGMLEAGKIDTISNQITITEERNKKYQFSAPYVYDGAQVVVHENNTTIKSLTDLAGKKVAVNLGSNFEAILRNHDKQQQIEIISFDTGVEQNVVKGSSDAFVMDRVSVLALIKKSKLPLKLVGNPIEVIRNALPFPRNERGDALRQQVDEALVAMQQDGTLANISNKWFGMDITTQS
ncbi:amino acid ABC transporter substrate-binding protein [Spartinivicinus marinus]|uniref:amino acid ABC transporter substrate-binding protein n=1 Tax=Spartinivicinus marinus TaxID=2994442 RepID=UPI002250E14D|nr:amino acid ABC transporter substrate-binding protein [Spartinivicinus marinus]